MQPIGFLAQPLIFGLQFVDPVDQPEEVTEGVAPDIPKLPFVALDMFKPFVVPKWPIIYVCLAHVSFLSARAG